MGHRGHLDEREKERESFNLQDAKARGLCFFSGSHRKHNIYGGPIIIVFCFVLMTFYGNEKHTPTKCVRSFKLPHTHTHRSRSSQNIYSGEGALTKLNESSADVHVVD